MAACSQACISLPVHISQRSRATVLCTLSLQEDQEEYAETGEKQAIPRHKRPVTKHWNWLGLAICLYYISAAIYYFVVRATRTLNMGYTG